MLVVDDAEAVGDIVPAVFGAEPAADAVSTFATGEMLLLASSAVRADTAVAAPSLDT